MLSNYTSSFLILPSFLHHSLTHSHLFYNSGLSLSGPATTTASANAPAATGFSFLSNPGAPSSAAPLPTAAVPPVADATSFSFLSSTSAPSSNTAPVTAGGFSFMNTASASPSIGSATADTLPTPVISGLGSFASLSSSSSSSSASVSALPSMTPIDVQVQIPAGGVIKKKKMGVKIGQERAEAAVGGGLLSGLVVHEEGGADETSSAQEGGSSMLAGMTLHANEEPSHDGSSVGGGGVLSSFGGGSILAGMQVHHDVEGSDSSSSSSSTSSATVVAGGFSFMKSTNNATENNDSMRASATSGRSALSALVSSPSNQAAAFGRQEGSSTAKMQRVVADLEEASRTNRMRLADLKIRARQLADNEKERSAEVEKLKAKVAEASAKQDEAIRHEQFEEAERLNEALDAAKGSLTAAEGRRMQVLQSKAEVEASQQQVFADARAASNLALLGLKLYGEERNTALLAFKNQVHATHVVLNEKLTSDEEQAQLKAKHVQAETQTVESEARQVESIISEQTGELVKLSAEVKAKHATLSGEVLELERLLEAKRREERAAALQLDECEQKIKQIAAKFDKQHVRLQTRREHIDNERAECAREAAEIAKAKAEFASSRKRDRRAERDLLAQIIHNAADVTIAEALNVALSAQDARRSELATQSASAHKALHTSLEAVDECLRATRATESRKAALEAQASGHNKTIHGIDASIPALNEEKKRAVADKKFKEAGRINDELKRLSDQREEAVKELSTCTTGVDAAEAELSGAGATLAALRAAAASTERTSDLERCELLKGAVRALSVQVRDLSKSRRMAALTPTVSEIDAQTLAPLVSNAEAEAAEDESLAATLAIEINKDSGMSSTQHAAVELLAAERDLLTEELNLLCSRHGVSSDIGPLPSPVENEKANHLQALSAPLVTTKEIVTEIESSGPTANVLSFESAVPNTAVESIESFSSSCSSSSDASDLFSRLNAVSSTVPLELSSSAMDESNNQESLSALSLLSVDSVANESLTAAPGLNNEESRQAELASISLALSSVEASLREKESMIEQFVQQENYDEADKIQVDLDAFLEHKRKLIQRAEELGSSESELLS